MAGPGVLDDVVQRFLGNPVEPDLDVLGQGLFALDRDGDRDPRPAHHSIGQLAKQAAQFFLSQGAGAQLQQHRPHLGQRTLGQEPQLLQALGGTLGIALPDG